MMTITGYTVVCDCVRSGKECGATENLGKHRTKGRAGHEAIRRGWVMYERAGRGKSWACPSCVSTHGETVFWNWRIDKP